MFFIYFLLAANAMAHVTLNPNFGAAAGNYFKTSIRIPHGSNGKETTKVVFQVPHGVLSAVPEALHGWDIEIQTRDITPYISHGNPMTTAPSVITWTATCTGDNAPNACDNADHAGLDHGHLLELEVQMKFGCDFGVDKDMTVTDDATVWMNQYTVWFRTLQYVSTPGTNDGNLDEDSMLPWTGAVEDMQSWGAATPKPSPYIFIYSHAACTETDSTGADLQLGMRWGASGEVIAPAENQEAIKSKAEVISLMDEMELDMKEEYDEKLLSASQNAQAAEKSAQDASMVAVIAACISGFLLLSFACCALTRAAKPDEFRRLMVPDLA